MNLQAWLVPVFGPAVASVLAPGLEEVARFLGTHLISGMIPAFFIAGAISVFLDKQRITQLMGPRANPFVSYPVAAFTGGILTVCSCGVIPIFAGIMNQGAGIGPAFTFLLAAPAINLIALTYTYSLIGLRFMVGRAILVAVAAMTVGSAMKVLFRDKPTSTDGPPEAVLADDDEARPAWPTILLFGLLFLVMLTGTGTFDEWFRPQGFAAHSAYLSSRDIRALDFLLAKSLIILTEVLLIAGTLWQWFSWTEARQWLRKSVDLFVSIFPKILLGIFLSGVLATLIPLSDPRLMALFDSNSPLANVSAAFIGALMYFGTIIGVNVVATLMRFGMHPGPAMTLMLAGPAVSLPSVLAVIPLVGRAKALAFFGLVVIVSALCGWLYGIIF